MNINKVYQHPICLVQEVEREGIVSPRIVIGSRVTILLHDTVNDNVFVSQGAPLGSMVPTTRLPSRIMTSDQNTSTVDEAQELALEVCGVEPKSYSLMFEANNSPELVFEHNTVYYCTFDSRGVPEENLVKGKDLIREALRGALGDMTTTAAAMYLKLMRTGVIK